MQRQAVRRLPPNKHPIGTRCIQFDIPDDDEWERAAFSELSRLTQWFLWERNHGKDGKPVADQWLRAMNTWRHCNDGPNENEGGISLEDLLSQQIRISPDNSCIIQMWCIDHWEDWYNPLTCVPGAASQNPPGGSPDAGTCKQYDALLQGSGKWILPINVSEGDTIEVLSANGGWTDGAGVEWWCPDGSQYLGGVCFTGGQAYDGADPCTSAFHMSIVFQVDGATFYPSTGTIVIPSGVTDAVVIFQANDSTLSDNSGSVNFSVQVCKAQETPFIITPYAGATLSRTVLKVNDEVTVTVPFQPGEGFYDGGFQNAVGATWQMTSIIGYTNAHSGTPPGGVGWAWLPSDNRVADPVVGETSSAGCTGFVGNSTTLYSITFKLISIP